MDWNSVKLLFSAEENLPFHVFIGADRWTCGFSSVHGADLKCEKGNSWMPWHIEAMKDVTLCDKRRGAGSRL